MVEQMAQMLALDTLECEAEVGELCGRQNTSPRACSQCCEERSVELRRTCNRTQVEAGDEVSGSLTPRVVELRLVRGRSPPEYEDNTGDSLQMEVEQWHGKLTQAPLSRLTRACMVVLAPYAENVAVAVGLQQEYASEAQRRS